MKRQISSGLLFLAVIAAILPIQEVMAEQSGTFTGTWVASGKRQPFDFVKGREIGTFKLTGHVNLKDEIGETEDYWAECVGLADSVTGSTVRCVWRSLKGEKAYSVISGPPPQEGVKATGEFVGGTGSLERLTGSFTFTWTSTFTDQNQGVFTGHTEDITGSYRIP